MKILQQRKPFENWTLQVDCNGKGWNQENKVPCGSTLEINTDDIIKREWFKYPDEEGMDYGFICPVCGCFTIIGEEHLDENLKNMARTYIP